MTNVTIIGAGNMGSAIATIATTGGHSVQVLARDAAKAAVNAQVTAGTVGDAITGDVVVLAVPYPAVAELLGTYAGQLDGKVLVDLTNPLDFATFDSLVVPADGSAASEIAAQVPEASVVKAFNTTFAGTLASGTVGDEKTTVLLAGDDADAKATLAAIIESGNLQAVDAGSLKRARELESIGFLQLTLAAGEKISWTAGFALIK
ncbi:diguanylate cyclase [Mycetocola manganoxydans]|uniref:Diguanylate cyclase n=1 Tax=Mycetocola manganoxydans TaxID=699879 RepID=A0A3L6ZQL2_9MICO|nr:NADPH-dependent F420 reductase [Mycetocola manganoxydans]RLP70223.1 diguanylate cyclase [Mycetocola manganoxydans]GHD49360.1 dinucleotide-binding protein [Mycetocola manganoxydans]